MDEEMERPSVMDEEMERPKRAAVFGAALLGGLASAVGVEMVGQWVPGGELMKAGAQVVATGAVSGALALGGAPGEVTLGVAVGGGSAVVNRLSRYWQIQQAIARLTAGDRPPTQQAQQPQQQAAPRV